MVSEKSLAPGTVIKGVKHSYRVVGVLRSDGQGFTYKTVVSVCRSGSVVEVPVVVREQMMVRCSSRGADGMTVITPDDIAPTVNSCLEAFIRACRERINLSRGCPWIINVIETFHANNTYYYVVEYLDGDTLEEYVRDMGGRLTFEQTRKVLSPIFDAVIALHNHRAVHADIHPRHVRFVKREREKIPVLFSLYATMHFSDRGVMRWALPPMTCEEGFAPPEQYNAIDHFCPQIDIYALASMVVFCLSGNILPDSRKLTEEMVRETLPPTIPETIVSALLNALHPDQSVRTLTVPKFREELGAFQRSALSQARTLIDEMSQDKKTPRWLKYMRRFCAKSRIFRKFVN